MLNFHNFGTYMTWTIWIVSLQMTKFDNRKVSKMVSFNSSIPQICFYIYIVSIYPLLFPVNLGNVIAAAYKSDKKNPFVSLSDHEMLEKYRVKSFEVQGNNSTSTLSALRYRKFCSFIWQSRRCYILKSGGEGDCWCSPWSNSKVNL